VFCAVAGLQTIRGSRVLLFLFNAGHGVPPLRQSPQKDRVPERSHTGSPDQMALRRGKG
jgi:hypothetical protein